MFVFLDSIELEIPNTTVCRLLGPLAFLLSIGAVKIAVFLFNPYIKYSEKMKSKNNAQLRVYKFKKSSQSSFVPVERRLKTKRKKNEENRVMAIRGQKCP